MAQKISTICDPCSDAQRERPAKTYEVYIDGEGGLVDLCAEDANVVNLVADMIKRHGRDPDSGKPRRAERPKAVRYRYRCDICAEVMVRTQRADHARSHDRPQTEIPWTRLDAKGEPVTTRIPCEAPDCEVVAEAIQGLIAHTRAKHPELLAAIGSTAGDPLAGVSAP